MDLDLAYALAPRTLNPPAEGRVFACIGVIAKLTAGFTCPPEVFLANKITRANAAPMAKGLPVAKIT